MRLDDNFSQMVMQHKIPRDPKIISPTLPQYFAKLSTGDLIETTYKHAHIIKSYMINMNFKDLVFRIFVCLQTTTN